MVTLLIELVCNGVRERRLIEMLLINSFSGSTEFPAENDGEVVQTIGISIHDICTQADLNIL